MLYWFEAGGAGQYGTLALGLLLLLAAGGHARARGAPRLRLILVLAVATLLHGAATCLEGFSQSLRLAAEASGEDRAMIALIGASETLTNVTFATLLVMGAALLVAVGEWRREQRPVPAQLSRGSSHGLSQ